MLLRFMYQAELCGSSSVLWILLRFMDPRFCGFYCVLWILSFVDSVAFLDSAACYRSCWALCIPLSFMDAPQVYVSSWAVWVLLSFVDPVAFYGSSILWILLRFMNPQFCGSCCVLWILHFVGPVAFYGPSVLWILLSFMDFAVLPRFLDLARICEFCRFFCSWKPKFFSRHWNSQNMECGF
jgi:hypothetical protein